MRLARLAALLLTTLKKFFMNNLKNNYPEDSKDDIVAPLLTTGVGAELAQATATC